MTIINKTSALVRSQKTDKTAILFSVVFIHVHMFIFYLSSSMYVKSKNIK